ncbi:CU044_5270 family protein, partial [Actinosynnema sp. NPDC059335]|uniref:CU044_5270 family protein n=1 Tax=Actinosynnema sp. NPDC059335 TaxID=3346804 RepID=UPI00366C7B0A
GGRSRHGPPGGGATGRAAAVAAAVTLFPSGETTPGGQAAATSAGPSEGEVRPVTDSVRLLSFAAEAARADPAAAPRPDQFVYTRSTGDGTAEREIWLSVDGTRDGLLNHGDGTTTPMPGCRDGRMAVHKGPDPLPGVTEPCEPRPAYRSDLPTDVDGMLAYLDANAGGEPGSVNARGKDVLALINEDLLPPASRAALYEAAARVPGLSVVPDARDAAGRAGVGITWPVPAGSSPEAKPVVIVFDAETYELLGTNFHAIVEQAVVDQAGQQP